MPVSPPIKTAKVKGRRSLHLPTIDTARAEADRLAAADHAGHLHLLGNWTLGQILNHLAVWTEYCYTRPPVTPPLLIRWIAPLFKRRLLTKGLPAGSTLPRVPGGTLGVEPATLDDGLSRFRRGITRLKTEPPTQDNVVFGKMTPDEWIQLHLRHAELHFSFVLDSPPAT